MPPTSPDIPPLSPLSRCLIDIGRVITGLIVAIILAPVLFGVLIQLMAWPEGGSGDALHLLWTAALISLFVGIAVSLPATIVFVVPGIILARWLGLMSPRTCAIGGAIVSGGIAAVGMIGFASPHDIDWRVIIATICAGTLSALTYWWIAERPVHGLESSKQP